MKEDDLVSHGEEKFGHGEVRAMFRNSVGG